MGPTYTFKMNKNFEINRSDQVSNKEENKFGKDYLIKKKRKYD